MRNSLSGLLAGAAVAAAMLVGFVSTASAQDLPVINFMSTNHESCSNYPQFVMQQMGFLEEQGYKVNLLNTDTSVPYTAFLANGSADVAVLGPGDVLQAVNAGQPIKVLYDTHQVVTDFIVVRADSPAQSMKDLEGKIIGLASDRDRLTAAIALNAGGMSIDQVQTVVVGDAGPVLARALTEGTIDAFAGGTTDRSGLIAAGVQIRNITPSEALSNIGNSIVAWGPTLEEKRPMITAFLKAWAESAHAGVLDQRAVYMACQKVIPEQWEQPGRGPAMIDNSIYNTQIRRTVKFGELQRDVWTNMQPPYVAVGDLAAPIDIATFLDDSFIDPVNTFTTDDVKAGIARFKAANPDMTVPQ
jgi:NitT/TauT family transport system substrate-binding protein